MNNTTYSLNIEFCMVRVIENGTTVNTAIKTDYNILTITEKQFEVISKEIEAEINTIMYKYTSMYRFKPND